MAVRREEMLDGKYCKVDEVLSIREDLEERREERRRLNQIRASLAPSNVRTSWNLSPSNSARSVLVSRLESFHKLQVPGRGSPYLEC